MRYAMTLALGLCSMSFTPTIAQAADLEDREEQTWEGLFSSLDEAIEVDQMVRVGSTRVYLEGTIDEDGLYLEVVTGTGRVVGSVLVDAEGNSEADGLLTSITLNDYTEQGLTICIGYRKGDSCKGIYIDTSK
jgi:hypothetical protein